MNHRKMFKMEIDMLMTIALLFLMTFQVTGDKYHEWIGAGMLLLFVIHNSLNFGWYKAIAKGNYTVVRILRTIVNVAVLIAILITGYSGIVMSRHVFSFLPIDSGMALARKLHLAGSYWAFVLMSVHLGMHGGVISSKVLKRKSGKKDDVTSKMRKEKLTDKSGSVVIWILRVIAIGISLYGAVLFGRDGIFSYMTMQNEFAMLDYESPAWWIIIKNLMMMSGWICVGNYLTGGLGKLSNHKMDKKKKLVQGFCSIVVVIAVIICSILNSPKVEGTSSWNMGSVDSGSESQGWTSQENGQESEEMQGDYSQNQTVASDEFVLIKGGTFEMGSPEKESWRSKDELQHEVTVSDFYMSAYELTQDEYQSVMKENPSNFSGDILPVESVSWLDAVAYCNARSEKENLSPVYQINGDSVSWNRGADGYRLPTEAEWEYACRAGTTTPFNTENSISPEESNYYGHYPYDIEENYFEQEKLTTQPDEYRETTVNVDTFSPNAWGLYNMHGNVSEWVWDYFGSYDIETVTDPTSGNLKVYRGGGWNDFAKNMRSAYRATLESNLASFNIGIRLVRNAVSGKEDIIGTDSVNDKESIRQKNNGKTLIAYFSWGGNTQGIAEEIKSQTGADLFEITLKKPYSEDYDTILIGYPNWWASIPMPIASFLEEYDFTGKTIIPFCSHGGGRLGQSLTAIAKLAPDSVMGEGLSIHYSGGDSLSSDVKAWLDANGVVR